MCADDDRNCPEFELHHQKLLDELDAERRSFLKSAFAAGGGAAALTAAGAMMAHGCRCATTGFRFFPRSR